jgi:autotransporter-associated beta strand protein
VIAGTGSGAGIGTITLGSGGVINTGVNRVEIFTPFTGSSGITKNGSGLLVVHGASTGFTGAWNINAGTLALGNATVASIPDTAAVAIAAGATLDMGIYGAALNDTFGSLAGAGSLRLQSQDPILGSTGSSVTAGGNNTSTTWTGTISGAGGRFTKSGTGTLTVNAAQTYTGLTQINGGATPAQSGALVLDVNGSLAPQSPVFFGTAALNAATLLVNADQTLGSLSNGGTLSIVNMQLSKLTIGSDNLSTQFNGVIAGSGRLTKSGTGLQGLAGTANSTWTGGTTVQSGTLAVNGDARLGQAPASPTSTNIALDGGVLANIFGTALPLSTNRGIQVTSNNGGLAVHGSTATMTTAAAITGLGRITKTGAGTLALGGGATAVRQRQHLRRRNGHPGRLRGRDVH